MSERPTATVAAYSVASFGINMVNAFSNAVLPLYLGGYGLPAWLIGVLAQQDSSLGGIEQPFIGLLSDRTRTRLGRRRPYFLVGVPLVAACLVALAARPPLWAVVLILTLFASFLAVAGDPYKSLLGDVFPVAQRGRVGAGMGLANMGGQVATLLLAVWLWEAQPALVCYLVAVGLALTFAVTFVGVAEPPLDDTAPATAMSFGGLVGYLRDLVSHREAAKYALSQLCFWFGIGGAVPFLTRFGVLVLGVSEATAFLLFLALVISTAVFTVPAGVLGDRLGKRRVMAWGLAGFAIVVAVGSLAEGAVQGAVVMALIGLPNAITTTLSLPLFVDLMPRARLGEFVGLAALVTSLAEAVGAGMLGAVVDLTDNYRAVFVGAAALIGLSWLLLLTVRPERVRPDG